ncbi:Predicted amidohydrolase [Prosthecobacter debontii]|uniref:Predicted amidohydrolase n=1 Tax=Prosthecobacter debontii TaxID=48467 RepID=A0A1T4YM61_9BACT|nr:carbon-nitrogen family hydrolase [Prosthecobacter debontii]SKB02924.1 Predicted amidohydrolase [Prosthecobacter debontii]
MNIHAVQLDPVWENKTANFDRVRRLLEATPPKPGSVIVLPEMFATGFSCQLDVTREASGGETERFLHELACDWDCAVIGGLVTSAPDGRGFNQALALTPNGHELARYTKIHPFSLGGESEVHTPGEQVRVFEWQGIKISPLICYDLRFPELARAALAQGAEFLIYIAAWPARRIQHWLTLLQARAIENQAYVLGVNRCGQEPQSTYCGRSALVDPHGVIVADASDGERILTCTISPQTVRNWRQDFPAVNDYFAGSGKSIP